MLTGFIVNGFRPIQANDTTIVAEVVSGDVTLTTNTCAGDTSNTYNTANSQLGIDVQSGAIASGCMNIAVSSGALYGYTLTIEGPANGQLTSGITDVIEPTTGTIESPAIFETQIASGAWGFAVPSGQIKGIANGFQASYPILGSNNTTNTTTFAAVPTTATPFSITSAPTTVGTPDQYSVYFAVAAGTVMASGQYSGVVTVSATANLPVPPTAPFMQEITAANCPTELTMAVDARDNSTYWVRRIPGSKSLGGSGDLCWMQTNLAYSGDGNNIYGDVIPVGNGSTGLAQGRQSAPALMLYDIPTGSNRTVYPTQPSTSVDGGFTNPQYGYLYNWCAAMNGQSAACQTSTNSQPDQSENTTGNQRNICPLGWRLPTGEPTTGEFTLLNNLINNGLTSTSQGLLTNGLFMYSGYFWNGSFNSQGGEGYFWSSTVLSAAVVHDLYFDSDYVDIANNSNKSFGYAVRCVAP
jgi:uncharacterized protein (TIGR02145 family)